ncbi:uncharacterized protein LOC123314426 [Coccinella septempunctata]|uniref:uncharacterized protein LOC123314426 n=1 Tax=Coccinella septempunctata TaxID=41139 RepID=UPI001D06F311|nr:uncharacterized protein LOC123314426 [Coccinella septempunctata]XP_044755651.1 uncharacterized protein LOC123314426 [Coccinella septempunctata]
MMEPYNYISDVDVITKQIETLRLHRRRRKNKNYDNLYFPKAELVKAYANQSPNRAYWLRHPREEKLNWSIDLIPQTKQFNKVVRPLKEAIGSNIQILNVLKITNKFLERQYELKKQLKISQGNCGEYIMYHYTTNDKVDAIVKNNFNWRLSGQSRGHKYGFGISFSGDPKFAEQFCKNKKIKVVFVVSVLISATQVGNEDMELPEKGFDTTVSPKKTVYVKFEDSEFYPEYIVFFSKNK